MERPRLRALLVASSGDEAAFASRVIDDHGDETTIASDVNDALARLRHGSLDVALVSLSLPRGDGLALVHHLRALHPDVDVIVLTHPRDVEELGHAMALGVLASVVLPLTGDALLVALDRARERRLLIAERHRLASEGASSRRRNATYARCAAFVAETNAAALAERVLEACCAELDAARGAIWVLDPARPNRLRRHATRGPSSLYSAELETDAVADIDPTMPVVREPGIVRIVLLGGASVSAVVEADVPGVDPLAEARLEALDLVAALGTAAFAAAGRLDAIAREGIKDPETSAYTFAYFGDVAGREIDRASRHGRRFALLTIALDGLEGARAVLGFDGMMTLRRAVTDAILESVRDSDVLARLEDDEFYLLLPETGLLGALGCRRRIVDKILAVPEVQRLRDRSALAPVVGIGVYPTDGSNLGRLLQVARRRADRARRGVFRRLDLGRYPFWEIVSRLVGSEDDAAVNRDGTIALHADLRAAHDEHGVARHVVMGTALLAQIGASMAEDAVERGVPGTLYVAGDVMVAGSVARAVDGAASSPFRAWVLGGDALSGSASRLRLPLTDSRLHDRVLLLSLTELGGYALVGRRVGAGSILAYHASDLDLVDALVASLRTTYHLQPEVR